MAYLKNTLIDYDNRTLGDYSVEDYFSIDFTKVQEYIDSCPSNWFDWHRLENNVNLEKVALDIYDDPDYWDVLLVINQRNPLFEFPFDYDSIVNMTEYKIENYVSDVYGKELSENAYNKF